MSVFTFRNILADVVVHEGMRRVLIVSVAVCALLGSGVVAADDNQQILAGLFSYQQKMAKLGNAEAQFKLAEMYEQGQGVPADPAEARHWYEAAAAQGYAPAQQRLARLNAASPQPAPPSASASQPAAAAITKPAATAAPAQATPASTPEEQERERLERELAASREALKKLQAQQAQQAQQRDAELRKAQAEKEEALRRLAAQQRLEEARRKMLATPSAFDN